MANLFAASVMGELRLVVPGENFPANLHHMGSLFLFKFSYPEKEGFYKSWTCPNCTNITGFINKYEGGSVMCM